MGGDSHGFVHEWACAASSRDEYSRLAGRGSSPELFGSISAGLHYASGGSLGRGSTLAGSGPERQRDRGCFANAGSSSIWSCFVACHRGLRQSLARRKVN